MLIKNRTNSDIVTHALRGENAQTTTGNMSTDHFRVGFGRFATYRGNLPNIWYHILNKAALDGRISQIIYSYSTPIAWHDSRYGWIVPDVSYSITTSSKHQTHLYRLRGQRIFLPWDATPEDAQRVLDGKMHFVTNYSGRCIGTVPGPNYVEGE